MAKVIRDDLISRKALYEMLARLDETEHCAWVLELVASAPAVDEVEVVRQGQKLSEAARARLEKSARYWMYYLYSSRNEKACKQIVKFLHDRGKETVDELNGRQLIDYIDYLKQLA